MSTYHEELARRIRQFRELIEPMDHRAHDEAGGPCFMQFDETQYESSTTLPSLKATRDRSAELIASAYPVSFEGDHDSDLVRDSDVDFQLPACENWRADDNDAPRFVQLAFREHDIQLDLPNTVIFPA